MNDDELLAGLKKASAADPSRARAPRWERLARGESDDAERRALEAIARDDEDSLAMAALTPPSASEEAALLEHVRRARGSTPIRRKAPARALVVATAALAIAAGVALFVSRPRPSVEGLPAYSLVVDGAERDLRSSAPGAASVLRLGPDAIVRIEVRPERDVAGPIAVRSFVIDHGVSTLWSAPTRISETGAVEIMGEAAALLPGGNGPRSIVVFVGRPGLLPDQPDAPHDERAQVFRIAVDVVGRH